MEYSIRDATVTDLQTTLEMNESEVPHVGSLVLDDMHNFLDMAAYFRVVCNDRGNILAFLIGLGPDSDYNSLNYRWFNERRRAFAYVDRIAVDSGTRRLGIAEALYTDFADKSASWAEFMCCEVNLVPENPVSMAFHQRIGFQQVGTLETGNGTKKVALLSREIG